MTWNVWVFSQWHCFALLENSESNLWYPFANSVSARHVSFTQQYVLYFVLRKSVSGNYESIQTWSLHIRLTSKPSKAMSHHVDQPDLFSALIVLFITDFWHRKIVRKLLPRISDFEIYIAEFSENRLHFTQFNRQTNLLHLISEGERARERDEESVDRKKNKTITFTAPCANSSHHQTNARKYAFEHIWFSPRSSLPCRAWRLRCR